MRRTATAIVALAILAHSLPGLADTDYVCLKSCVDSGVAPHTCLAKCTFDSSPSALAAPDQPHENYACLKQCTDGGGTSASCTTECMSDPAQGASRGASVKTAQTHGVFKAPTPIEDLILRPRDRAALSGPSKDFNCMNTCLQGGMQYQLCNLRCTQ